MAVNDLFELKVYQDYANRKQECLNVYFFNQATITGNADTLIDAFLADIDPAVREWQSLSMKTSFLQCRNLFNVTDFAARDVSADDLVGQVATGDMLPVHDVVTFRLIRTSRGINNGYKRYSGIPEPAQSAGLINEEGTITALGDLAIAMSGTIHAGTLDADGFDQVIVKRVRSGSGTTEDPYKYRLPLTIDEAVISNPASVLVNLFVRHQNSRSPQ